jgi:hypothetical protein
LVLAQKMIRAKVGLLVENQNIEKKLTEAMGICRG